MNSAVTKLTNADLRQHARRVISIEQAAIGDLKARIDDAFIDCIELILQCQGKVVVIGIGKSGHIGSKLAATLASTGTPSFFVHPAEASHGDLGMITAQDVVIALSNSGETQELLSIMPVIKRLDVPLIAMCGKQQSSLGQHADIYLDVSVREEACPLGLAPTASTTAALVMGDALAVTLLTARGFTSEDFARSHPAGQLGRRLLMRIGDIMHTGDKVPAVTGENAAISEVILEMSQKSLGMSAIVDADFRVLGIFTDGDLRRAVDSRVDIHNTRIGELMTRDFKFLSPDDLAWSAANLMQEHAVHSLLVLENERLVGALNIHDLLQAGVL